jgi:hypothetical protein
MASEKCLTECLTILRLMKGDRWEPAHSEFYAAAIRDWPDELAKKIVNHCANTMTFRPSRAELLAALQQTDGRPGVEEAWSMLVWDEYATTVLTEEMRLAQGIAYQLYDEDRVAARMAFKEKYTALVHEARNTFRPVKWEVSLGWDRDGRKEPIKRAIEAGKLSIEAAHEFIPELGSREPITSIAAADLANKKSPPSLPSLLSLPNPD